MKTFHVGYRGFVYIYTPIQAETREEAEKILNDMDCSPSSNQELFIANTDFDFELESDYIYDENEIKRQIVDPNLANEIINNAKNQAAEREKKKKILKAEEIRKQIQDAETNLVNSTKAISEQIEKLKLELNNLK